MGALKTGSEATDSSLGKWASEALELDSLGRVKVSDAYREYCLAARLPAWPDYRGVSRSMFSRSLRKLLGPGVCIFKSSGSYLAGVRWRIGITTNAAQAIKPCI